MAVIAEVAPLSLSLAPILPFNGSATSRDFDDLSTGWSPLHGCLIETVSLSTVGATLALLGELVIGRCLEAPLVLGQVAYIRTGSLF